MTLRSKMFRKLLLGTSLAISPLCTSLYTAAQSNPSFAVPFPFSANTQVLPAGSYAIKRVSSCMVALYNVKTGKGQFVMVRPNDSGHAIETQSRLVFRRYGSHAYLTQVWSSATSIHSDLVAQPTIERNTTKAIPQAGSSFEVALK